MFHVNILIFTQEVKVDLVRFSMKVSVMVSFSIQMLQLKFLGFLFFFFSM